MAIRAVPVFVTLTTVNGSIVTGDAIYVGMDDVGVQVVAPANSLGRIGLSNDKKNWWTPSGYATLDPGIFAVPLDTGRSLWLRPETESDGSGPREVHFIFAIRKEQYN